MRHFGSGVALVLLINGCGGPAAPTTDAQRTVKTERGALRMSVAATGEIRPLRQIELKSKASGQVVRFTKREGDAVAVGELLVELDRRVEERNVQRAEAERNTAEARLQLTRLEYDRSLKNAGSIRDAAKVDADYRGADRTRLEALKDSVTPQELETARLNARLAEEKLRQAEAELTLVQDRKDADLRLAEAAVQQSTVTLEDAQERLGDTSVRSPIDGILLQKLIEEGQIVSSGISAASGGTALAVVADVQALAVEANIDETDIGRLKEEQAVELTVDAHPRKKFSGKVELIPPLGVLESNIRVYKVKILVAEKGVSLLKVGMTANVEIITQEKADVVQVSSEAISSDKEGIFVWIPEGPGRKRVPVKIGLDNGRSAEVVEGLQEGQEVLVVYSADAGPQRRGGRFMR